MQNLFQFSFNGNFDRNSNDAVKMQIFNRIKIISQMQDLLNEVLPPVFKNYVRIFNFSQQSIILHVINGIVSAKIRNLSGRISRRIWQSFKNYSNCQLEIYVQPQTILNYLHINNMNNLAANSTENRETNAKTNTIFSYKDDIFSHQTLSELQLLTSKMNLHPKLKSALEKVIQSKSQHNIQFAWFWDFHQTTMAKRSKTNKPNTVRIKIATSVMAFQAKYRNFLLPLKR